MSFCRRLGVPFGINVESVSIRRVEIEAGVGLAFASAAGWHAEDAPPGVSLIRGLGWAMRGQVSCQICKIALFLGIFVDRFHSK